MKKIVLREIGIFLFLLFFLSIWMHYKEWLDHPIAHLEALPKSQFGLLHPLVFTFVLYILISIVRLIVKYVRRFASR